ncbi:hypothetical protein E2C01_059398 [Portunus trituberculatus]|uniref:Uncharacterized protein n=1 Tax=Portunus trituberculatus TaxID=210409 RepID=A0A5B7H6L8_PORTR|nr:hypothetical protein [Portunus trituberculatus]
MRPEMTRGAGEQGEESGTPGWWRKPAHDATQGARTRTKDMKTPLTASHPSPGEHSSARSTAQHPAEGGRENEDKQQLRQDIHIPCSISSITPEPPCCGNLISSTSATLAIAMHAPNLALPKPAPA